MSRIALHRSPVLPALMSAALCLSAAAPASAATRPIPLPYQFSDGAGNMWMLYGNGLIQSQGGNNPSFSQMGQLSVNNGGNGVMIRAGQTGKLDDKTGEVTLENLSIGGLTVTRRILPNKEDGTIRYVDTLHSPTGKEIAATINYHSNFNFGITASRTVMDSKKKDNALGWAGFTGNNRGVFVAYALDGAKVTPHVNYPEGSNVVNVSFSLTVPADRDVSLIHFHGTADTLDKAADLIASTKPAKLLATVAPEIRRTLVNVRTRTGFGDDLEILRGDTLDVVETRNGDALRGTLKDATYPLKTSFGRVELPADKVLALLSVGKQHPLQLIVTVDGEVFGGTPEREFVTLQLSSGQTVKIPASQVSRAGYRRRPSEPDEINFTKPAIILRTGERVAILPPTSPIEVATRFGVIKLDPSTVASITLKSEDASVHQIALSDGSKLSGLLIAPSFDLTLDGAAGPVHLTIPTSSLARLRPTVAPDPDAPEEDRPELRCTGDDVLHGTIDGTFSLDTAFETVTIRGDQVRKITRANPNSTELQVTLWDQTLLSGQPTTATLPVKLVSGPTVIVPLDLLDSYANNAPKTSDDTAAKVKDLVAKLNDDDFKVREAAQQSLIATGSSIVPLLKDLKPAQPPEAQQRIDQILSQLDK
jgi:hypothetical protein